jgi:hypothetical protein
MFSLDYSKNSIFNNIFVSYFPSHQLAVSTVTTARRQPVIDVVVGGSAATAGR